MLAKSMHGRGILGSSAWREQKVPREEQNSYSKHSQLFSLPLNPLETCIFNQACVFFK